jgi:hypothetical protein
MIEGRGATSGAKKEPKSTLIAECWEEGQEGKSKWRKERGEVGVVSSWYKMSQHMA